MGVGRWLRQHWTKSGKLSHVAAMRWQHMIVGANLANQVEDAATLLLILFLRGGPMCLLPLVIGLLGLGHEVVCVAADHPALNILALVGFQGLGFESVVQ
jgi:hypothetical protein